MKPVAQLHEHRVPFHDRQGGVSQVRVLGVGPAVRAWQADDLIAERVAEFMRDHGTIPRIGFIPVLRGHQDVAGEGVDAGRLTLLLAEFAQHPVAGDGVHRTQHQLLTPVARAGHAAGELLERLWLDEIDLDATLELALTQVLDPTPNGPHRTTQSRCESTDGRLRLLGERSQARTSGHLGIEPGDEIAPLGAGLLSRRTIHPLRERAEPAQPRPTNSNEPSTVTITTVVPPRTNTPTSLHPNVSVQQDADGTAFCDHLCRRPLNTSSRSVCVTPDSRPHRLGCIGRQRT